MKPALGKGASILAQKLEDVHSTSEPGGRGEMPSTRPPILPSSLSLFLPWILLDGAGPARQWPVARPHKGNMEEVPTRLLTPAWSILGCILGGTPTVCQF